MTPHNVIDQRPEACTGRSGAGCDASAAPQPAPNIMIVDDNPANLMLLVEMLARRGYRTQTMVSGKQALRALQAARAAAPDLILLDITMSEMNGYEVCEILKADTALKDIPVIFISALSQTSDKLQAFRAGGVDYVTKPFQFEEVYARVETHLRICSLQSQLAAQNATLECMVAERSADLSNANVRLRELGRITNDFLQMISHEMRTPANGVLGLASLIVDLCPASEERTLYVYLLDKCALRFRNLIEDSSLISDMKQLTLERGPAALFSDLLADVSNSLPEIHIAIAASCDLVPFSLNGHYPLLKRAMASVILLATDFSRNKHNVEVSGVVEDPMLRLRIELDALSLPRDNVEAFFEIESGCRSASTAEALGLAPVVAHQIIRAFGGQLRLVKAAGDKGCLEVTLRKELGPA